jgi:hypothetical protein
MKFTLARLFETIGQPFFVWTLDFTMGSDLWDKVPVTNFGMLRQVGYQTAGQYWNEVWGFPVKIGFDAVTQFWSSEEPGDHFVPHLHAIQPRVFTEASTGRVLTDVHVKYIDESRIKEIWRSRLEAELGAVSRAKVAGSYEKFSCRVNYITGLGAPDKNRGLDKRLRYQYRGIPWDYNLYALSNQDYSHWDRDWVRWSLTVNYKRHQTYGLLSATNLSPKGSFARSIGFDIGTKRERDRLRGDRVCPYCGSPIVLDHDNDEEFGSMSRYEASRRGLELWKSQVVDENAKYLDFVPYHSEGVAS